MNTELRTNIEEMETSDQNEIKKGQEEMGRLPKFRKVQLGDSDIDPILRWKEVEGLST